MKFSHDSNMPAQTIASTDRPARIRALAGARALPPLVLVLFHYCEGHGYRHFWPLDLVVARGYLWVEFFFALSGFVLMHVHGARQAELLTGAGWGAFLRARLIRLYPLHLFLLLVMLGIVIGLDALAWHGGYHSIFQVRYHQDVSVKGFVLSLLLLHAWNTMDRLTWNTVSWFVSVELALCLVFPLLAALAKGRPWRGLAFVAAGVAGLWALDITSPHGLDITYHDGVLRGLSDFAIGIGMAVLYGACKPRDKLPAAAHSAIQAALVAWLFYAFYHTGWSHTRADIWVALPMLALVPALAFDRGIVAAALGARLPQRLGDWSYAIYLGQTTWLLVIRFFEQRIYPAHGDMVLGRHFIDLIWWLEPALLVLVCAGWGAVLTRWIERPAAAFLKARLDPGGAPASLSPRPRRLS